MNQGQPRASAFNRPLGSSGANPFAAGGPAQQPWQAPPSQPPYGSRPGTPPGSPFGAPTYGAPTYGAPAGAFPSPGPVPQPKGGPRPLMTTLIVLCAAIVVAIAVLSTVIIVRGDTEVVLPPIQTSTTPSAGRSTPPPSPSATRTSESSAPPESSTPPSTSTTPASPGSTQTDSTYADAPELSQNKVYQQQWGALDCQAVGNGRIPDGTGPAKAWFEKLVDCMMDRWGPVLEKSGYTLTRPPLILYDGTATSPCGEGRRGFYCSSNETIYIETEEYRDYRYRLNTVRMLFHEFAHHVQYRTQILDTSYDLERENKKQVSRRVEIQAECWAISNVSLLGPKYWTAKDLAEFTELASHDAQETHGTGKSRTYWFKRIVGKGDLGLCNTWIAPLSVVA